MRRGAKRAEYDRATLLEILRVGTVAHVGVVTDTGPLVLPMVYGITDDTMYLHGALANALIGSSVNVDICVTVTIVDGLVFAKTPFNHSMNYRSVVVRGQARLVADSDEVLRALQLMTLARPATIPRARVAETGQKRIPIIQLIGVKQARAFYGSAS